MDVKCLERFLCCFPLSIGEEREPIRTEEEGYHTNDSDASLVSVDLNTDEEEPR